MAVDEKTTGPVDRAEGAERAEPGAEQAGAEQAEPGAERRRGRAGRIVTALVIVALLAATGILGYLTWQNHRDAELRRSASDDATRLVTQLATYDHTDVDANLDAVVADATPDFAERYREVSDGLRELLASGEGTSTGTVTHAAVESVDGDRAVVLVFLDQEISNVTVPDGRVDSSRMVVTVVRDGDRWLLDDAQLA
ncbi:hypothetical protein [Dietzia sp. B32]|uniref:hypothetical protein n=1 Tax=Dietzia sp. B32 TaxID=2915130 RepID=UPI0021AE321E|nr:hypothetical protein [Dietzia sp. B32]UVE93958.1 hypothetical protein L8M95_10315 [Dietzia sp. B32]